MDPQSIDTGDGNEHNIPATPPPRSWAARQHRLTPSSGSGNGINCIGQTDMIYRNYSSIPI
jgi:hypothetical protein